jgi:hypothetical protein
VVILLMLHMACKRNLTLQQLLLLLQPAHCAQTILLEACARSCNLLVQIIKLCATSSGTQVLLSGCWWARLKWCWWL